MNNKMLARLLSASAIVSVLTAPTLAADMPVKARPAAVQPQLWSGFYIGAHVGGAWARDRYSSGFLPGPVFRGAENLAAFTTAGAGDGRDTGFIGGAQAGYNWRSGTFVYGIEADFSGLSNHPELVRTGALAAGAFIGTPFTIANSTRADWMMTFRPRVGVAVDNALFYVTGGGAVMQVRRTGSFVDQTPIPDTGSTSERRLLPGWVVGGGLEYALGGNWSAKGEYLYAQFAGNTLGYTMDFAGNNAPNTITVREQLSLQVARFGLNYQFGNAGSASAPALITKAPQAAGFTWSGIYAGAHAGWVRTSADFETTVFPGEVFASLPLLAQFSAAGTGSAHKDGIIGGGQIGANAQFNQIVIGLEADFSGIGGTATLSRTNPINPPPSTYTVANSAEVDWLATLRARLGFAFDRSLIYATAGGAMARVKTTGSFVDTTPAPNDFGSGGRTETVGGWVIGGGYEYAFAQSWSLKAEYLHVNLSRGFADYDISYVGNGGLTHRVFVNNDLTLQTARVGLNYKFGGIR